MSRNRARQIYKNISMLFLFPVKDGKLSTGVIAILETHHPGYRALRHVATGSSVKLNA